jgi:hypothetical protein
MLTERSQFPTRPTTRGSRADRTHRGALTIATDDGSRFRAWLISRSMRSPAFASAHPDRSGTAVGWVKTQLLWRVARVIADRRAGSRPSLQDSPGWTGFDQTKPITSRRPVDCPRDRPNPSPWSTSTFPPKRTQFVDPEMLAPTEANPGRPAAPHHLDTLGLSKRTQFRPTPRVPGRTAPNEPNPAPTSRPTDRTQ